VCGKHINGLQAGGNASPLVKNNKICNSSGSGIVLHDWSRGTYANNHVEGSKLAGVGIRQKKKMFSKVYTNV
jgi:parallel beta-helix repeat protein